MTVESSVGQDVAAVGEQRPLTPAIAKDVFRYSFYLSQGDAGFQEVLFEYIHIVRPRWRIDDSLANVLIESISRMAVSMGEKGLHKDIESLKAAAGAGGEAIAMATEFNESYRRNKQEVIKDITALMIGRDHRFTVSKPKGVERVRSSPDNPEAQYNPLKDKELSHFCYYVLGNHEFGVPEYDQMLEDMRQYVNAYLPRRFFNAIPLDAAREVVDAYNATHPTMQVALPWPDSQTQVRSRLRGLLSWVSGRDKPTT